MIAAAASQSTTRHRESGGGLIRSAAPSFLFPLLAKVEEIDRWRRGIRPIRPGGILGIEPAHHAGSPLTLGDGTRVAAGDRVGVIHLDNRVIRALPPDRWLSDGMRLAQADLQALARHAAREEDAPVAYRGTTVLAPLLRRAGWEVRPRRRTTWVRLEDWYMRTLLARWSLDGVLRLRHGRHALRSVDGWLSADELQRRYGTRRESR